MTRTQRISCAAIAAVTSGALILGTAPAFAADGPPKASTTAAAVEKATGTGDIAKSAVLPSGAVVAVTTAEGEENTVIAPASAAGAVLAVTGDSGNVSVGLPATSPSSGIKAGKGTVVYPGAAKGADLAVQPTSDGVRALVTINSASAAKEYRFDLGLPDGATVSQLADGRVLVTTGEELLASFDAPWAKDADGNAVPTDYRIENNALVQTVDFNNATRFPVVADPYIKRGFFTDSLYFTRGEVKKASRVMNRYPNSTAAAVAGLSAAGCMRMGGKAAVICGGIGALGGSFVVDQFTYAAKKNRCIRLRYVKKLRVPAGIYVDGTKNCR